MILPPWENFNILLTKNTEKLINALRKPSWSDPYLSLISHPDQTLISSHTCFMVCVIWVLVFLSTCLKWVIHSFKNIYWRAFMCWTCYKVWGMLILLSLSKILLWKFCFCSATSHQETFLIVAFLPSSCVIWLFHITLCTTVYYKHLFFV